MFSPWFSDTICFSKSSLVGFPTIGCTGLRHPVVVPATAWVAPAGPLWQSEAIRLVHGRANLGWGKESKADPPKIYGKYMESIWKTKNSITSQEEEKIHRYKAHQHVQTPRLL